jgi:hypothetical protein
LRLLHLEKICLPLDLRLWLLELHFRGMILLF